MRRFAPGWTGRVAVRFVQRTADPGALRGWLPWEWEWDDGRTRPGLSECLTGSQGWGEGAVVVQEAIAVFHTAQAWSRHEVFETGSASFAWESLTHSPT